MRFFLNMVLSGSNPKALKKILKVIDSEKSRHSKQLKKLSIESDRVAAAKALAELYQVHKTPENVPDEPLRKLIRYHLTTSATTEQVEQSVQLLKRGKSQLKVSTANLSAKAADKKESFNEQVDKGGPIGLAVLNIGDAVELLGGRLKEISVRRSHLRNLLKSDPGNKIEEFLLANFSDDIGHYVLHEVLGFSATASKRTVRDLSKVTP